MSPVAVVIVTEAMQRVCDRLLAMGLDKSDIFVGMFTLVAGMADASESIAEAQGLTPETYLSHNSQVAMALIWEKMQKSMNKLITPTAQAENAAMGDPIP